MYQAGVPLSKMRLCQPYGDDQRKGLYLYKILEPETWGKIVSRVEGANFGNRYAENSRTVFGNFKINLPEGHTYKSYTYFLLDTMPPYLRRHYVSKINKFLEYWKKHGYKDDIPQTADRKLEAQRKAPSWRRICKVLLKNDYWCKGLSFSQTKGDRVEANEYNPQQSSTSRNEIAGTVYQERRTYDANSRSYRKER